MQQEQDARNGGHIWNDRQYRSDGERHLVIGIAAYTKRRKRVVETTTIPEIPRDAA